MKKSLLLIALILFWSMIAYGMAGDPVANAFSTPAVTDYSVGIQLQGSQVDGHPLTYVITTFPTHGTLSGLNSSTGYVVYHSTPGYLGVDTLAYTVTGCPTGSMPCGSPVTTAPATVTINVNNQKTTINGCFVNPDSTPAVGKITWQLMTSASSPGGFIPAKAGVTATLDNTGCYTVSIYPSIGLAPQSNYALLYSNTSTGQQQTIGNFAVPPSATVVTQSGLALFEQDSLSAAGPTTLAPYSALLAFVNAIASAGTFVPGNITLGSGLSGSGLTNSVNGSGTAINLTSDVVRTGQANTYGTFKQTFKLGTNLDLVDPSDITKIVRLDASNVASGVVRTVNIPNNNSTTVQSISAVSHQFLTAMNAQGLFTQAQPAASDITGLAASATTDTTNASNISSGTLPNGRLSGVPSSALNLTTTGCTNQVVTAISSGGVGTCSSVANAMITNGTIDLTTKVTGVLPLANGGTNFSSAATNNVVIVQSSTSLGAVGPGSSGDALLSSGGGSPPSFGNLAPANGGTGKTSLTTHGVMIGNNTSSINVTSAGTAGQFLVSGGAGADPSFQDRPTKIAVVTTQFDKTADTTLANVTGLSFSNLTAGETYTFEAVLNCTFDATNKAKVAIGGTATATTIFVTGSEVRGNGNSSLGLGVQTALATALNCNSANTSTQVLIKGMIKVNASGTLTVQFAQLTSGGTSSVLVGSYFVLTDTGS